jgi:hypothetical protein
MVFVLIVMVVLVQFTTIVLGGKVVVIFFVIMMVNVKNARIALIMIMLLILRICITAENVTVVTAMHAVLSECYVSMISNY